MSVSFVLTSSGGGLYSISDEGGIVWQREDVRPGAIDADDTPGEEPVGVDVLNVGDVPPLLIHAGQREASERQR